MTLNNHYKMMTMMDILMIKMRMMKMLEEILLSNLRIAPFLKRRKYFKEAVLLVSLIGRCLL